MNSGKTKKKKQSGKPSLPSWEQVRRLPVKLFHTLQGPVMGRVEKETGVGVLIWAPARLATPTPSSVVYLPVAFVETRLLLRWATMFGTSDAPAAVLQGYEGYFDQFLQGSYTMRPVVINAGVDAETVTTEAPPQPAEPKIELCPACKQGLSAWNAHHPVKVDDVWKCEIDTPNIRELYPDARPERPVVH